jgi:hypothetical protein
MAEETIIVNGLATIDAASRNCHTRESGYPVITDLRWIRDAAEYWIIRFRG